MKKTTRYLFTGLGFPTMLLTFSMICIVTFSALTLIAANSDYRQSKKVAQNSTDYYTAEKKAYDTLAFIDQQLQQVYFSTHTDKEFCRQSRSTLSKMTLEDTRLELSTKNYKDLVCHFSEKISERQTLEITLLISYPHSDTMPFFSITQWQMITEDNLEEYDSLNIVTKN